MKIPTMAVAFALAWHGSASGQQLPRKRGKVLTVEWMASHADVVVHAKIREITETSKRPWHLVQADAIEVVKGELAGRFEFAIICDPKWLLHYRDREVLLFLIEGSRHDWTRYEAPPASLVIDSFSEDWALIGLQGNLEDCVVTMDFEVIQDPALILKASREAVAYQRGMQRPKPYQIVLIPRGTKPIALVSGFNRPGMVLPRDERLEAKSRQWLNSPIIDVRLEGMLGLRLYPSEANIDLIKACLKDRTVQGNKYIIATGAYNVLCGLGIECDEPPFEVPVEPDDVDWDFERKP